MSERNTENLVRDRLRALDYYSQKNSIRVEEQKSEIIAVKRLLKTASKSGHGGSGSPEFIISSADNPDFLLIIECKGSVLYHTSASGNDPIHYAVDGVLHYASFLSKEFNVIAIAVSGQTNVECKVSSYLHTKGSPKSTELKTKHKTTIDTFIRVQRHPLGGAP